MSFDHTPKRDSGTESKASRTDRSAAIGQLIQVGLDQALATSPSWLSGQRMGLQAEMHLAEMRQEHLSVDCRCELGSIGEQRDQ